MKKYLLNTVIVFLTCILSIYAQDQKEMQIKLVKDVNGKTTEIDTIIVGTNSEGLYFTGDSILKEFKITSDMKKFEISDKDSLLFLTLTDEIQSDDTLKNICIKLDSDLNGDSICTKKFIYNLKGDEKDIIKCKDGMVWIASDSADIMKKLKIDGDNQDLLMALCDGKKLKVIKNPGGKEMIWNIDSTGDVKVISDDHVLIYKTEDGNFDILKSMKSDKKEKTINLFITDEDDQARVKIETLGEDIDTADANVKVYKYKTDDGKVIIKALISDCDLSKVEEQKAKDLGLVDKKELEVKNLKIYPNPTDGIFNIEFELEKKENVILKIYNQQGKAIYTDKIKKFNGYYSNEIDLTKEESGIYFVRIIQNDNSVTKKILKK